MHRFLIIIEKAGDNFSAYSPDLPGCVATGATREETERRMYEAIDIASLIQGDLPQSDDERYQMIDAPRYRLARLLAEPTRARDLLRACRNSGAPFALFLRNFSVEQTARKTA